MSDMNIKPPIWFWIISIFLLIWGLVGISLYWLEMTMADEAYVKWFGETALGLRDEVPVWSIAGYAIGVWVGLLGSIWLLLRKALALPLYIISIFGAFIGWAWYVIDARARVMMNENDGWIMLVVVFALCLFSIWFVKFSKRKNWLS